MPVLHSGGQAGAIEVTAEMIEAGRNELIAGTIMFPVSELGETEQGELVTEIYLAMASKSA